MAHPDGVLHDLDDQRTFDKFSAQVQSPDCQNLAVKFGEAKASFGFNLTADEARHLLENRATDGDTLPCLWLNLWGWTKEHQSIVRAFASQYHLSPRLAHSICPRTQSSGSSPAPSTPFYEPETKGQTALPDERIASMADVFNAVWHFGTVDFGRRYICLGWNGLFFLPHSEESTKRSKPNAVRIWSTVLLCNDGTVLSVFESPSAAVDAKMVSRIRQNQVGIFKNLSRAEQYVPNALMNTAIRSNVASGTTTQEISSEMASLLFYYVFDDWLGLFIQVSGSKHSYRYQLELLRQKMIQNARPEQVDLLHQLGKQLNALKSVCKNYQSMIDQLVRNKMVNANDKHPQMAQQAATDNTQGLAASARSSETVSISPGTVARFDRLMNRIELCAMTELNECLTEKDGLVQMNFNLIALAQASTVERLTRTTILLAKVTMLFLPISLATSYFSMQVEGITTTPLRTYWLTFLVVTLVTIFFLAGFEWISARYSDTLVYTGLTKKFIDHRRQKKKT